jgi:AcrR family transcriptional regulator
MAGTILDTKQQIALAAIQMFRQYGYTKTTVGDIAKACSMSPANIYRFFPSKDAIIEELARVLTKRKQVAIEEIVHKPLSASDRLEEFATFMLWSNRTDLVDDANMYELVSLCVEKHWPVIGEHLAEVRRLLAIIIQDGIDKGEFTFDSAVEAAEVVFNCMCKFHHPQMLAQHIDQPLEQQVRSTIRLLCRGLRSPEPLRNPS